MSKNKIYTQSYFIKRLVEEGFDVYRLNVRFSEKDTRKWALVINFNSISSLCNIIVICNKMSSEDYYFKLIGNNMNEIVVRTQSMKIIIEQLKGIYFDALTKDLI